MNTQLQQAIEFIKSGNKKSGYHLLVTVIKAEPTGKDAETAWLWMSSVLNDPEKKRKCLETVLKLNPNNELAKKGLACLNPTSPSKQESDLPNLKSIPTKPLEQNSNEISVKPAKNKNKLRNTLLLILFGVMILVCYAMFSSIASLNKGNANSTSYNVVFRVTGSSGNASIAYGKSGDTFDEVQVVQLPWESSMKLRYGDTATLVAGNDNNSSVTCEIWVDGKLRTSAVSSSQTDNMAVCGFIVGRNITIKATE